jgi:glycosyltransferase involved in cell wall biosynthesis
MSLFLGRLNVSLLISDLKHLTSRMGIDKPVIMTLNPYSHRLVKKAHKSLAIYDCVDDWPAFSDDSEKVWKKERKLIEVSDAVLATSSRILSKRKAHAKRIFLVSNAADFEHFQAAMTDSVSVAPELAKMDKPIIGYIGALYRWVDFGLIAYLARRNPSWNIVLIGPTRPDLRLTVEEPNVHFLGEKPYEQIPTYLKGIDVCAIPFKVNEITLSVDPVKIYEYLAAGKPVVSVSLPELEKFRGKVRIAKDYNDFERLIVEALKRDDSLKSERMDLARQNTWEQRAVQISQIIDEVLTANKEEVD